MNPSRITRHEMKVIGLEVRTDNARESDPATAKIGALWAQVLNGALAHVSNQVPDARILAVYTDYESDHLGEYTFVLGMEVNSLEAVPEGMRGLTVPAADCLVFKARGEMPKTLIETWVEIWNYFPKQGLTRAYNADVEIHLPKGAGADIYIAVSEVSEHFHSPDRNKVTEALNAAYENEPQGIDPVLREMQLRSLAKEDW